MKKSTVIKASILLCFLMSSAVVFAQPTTQKMTLQEVSNLAISNAQTLKVSKLQEQYHQLMLNTAGELPKTQFNTELGNYNSIFFDSKFSATQTFSSGGFYKQQKNLLGTYLEVAKAQTLVQKAELKKMVEQLYVELQTLQAKQLLLLRIDSMYNNYYQIAKLRFEKGETSLLEKITLENKANQSKLALQLIEDEVSSIQQQLGIVLQTNIKIIAAESLTHQHQLFDTSLVANHPYLKFQLQQQQVAMAQTNVEKSMLKPDWFVGYNNQSLMGWQQRKDASEVFYDGERRFSSVVLGMHVPLFAKPQKAKIEAAKANEQTQAAMTELTKQQLNMQVQKYFITYVQFEKAVQYFTTKGVVQSNLMITTAGLNYKAGQINYFEWSSLLQDAFNIQFDYIEALKNKQLTAVELNYLLQQ